MRAPVALIIFNRPEHTRKVFGAIAKAKPQHLFVIADGPRKDYPEDQQKCKEARAVIDLVDWPCHVHKNYENENMGCGRRPATGINWVFQQVEEAIILEDDCVPHPSFFRFCDELLERYRDDERIMQINGQNFQNPVMRSSDSYYFAYSNNCWGWATWRRAWQYFDWNMELWPELRKTQWLRDLVRDKKVELYWRKIFDHALANCGDVDYWDFQWRFAVWAHGGLSVWPGATLVSNIGFGEEATHTTVANYVLANLPVEGVDFPLRHPQVIQANKNVDAFLFNRLLKKKKFSFGKFLKNKVLSVLMHKGR